MSANVLSKVRIQYPTDDPKSLQQAVVQIKQLLEDADFYDQISKSSQQVIIRVLSGGSGGGAIKVFWTDIRNKPVVFPPGAHTHTEIDITDLDKYTTAEVDAKDEAIQVTINAHMADQNNPHGVSFDQLSDDAPQDGELYGRKPGVWQRAVAASGDTMTGDLILDRQGQATEAEISVAGDVGFVRGYRINDDAGVLQDVAYVNALGEFWVGNSNFASQLLTGTWRAANKIAINDINSGAFEDGVLMSRVMGDLRYSAFGKVQWRGMWESGVYDKDDMVRDGDWTSIANKFTGDRPAPQPDGDPGNTMPDAPTWTTEVSPGRSFSGNRFVPAQAGWVTAARISIPVAGVDRAYRLLVVHIIDPATNEYEVMLDAQVPTSSVVVGWWGAQTALVWLAGETYEVLVLAENSSTPAVGFAGTWQYAGQSQNGDPFWGGWNTDNQETTIRFHEEQTDGLGSAAVALAALGPGDAVTVEDQVGGVTWTFAITSAPSISNQIYSYTCTKTGAGTLVNGVTTDVSWGDPNALPDQERDLILSHWTANAPTWASTAQGVVIPSSGPRVLSTTGYGADITFQPATISPDWDIVAASGSSTGSSGTGTGTVDLGGGVTISTGVGTPEAAVTAPVGSMYTRSDGGTGTTLYIKESGVGNTGWVAK